MLTPVAPSTSNINDRLQCRRHLKAEEVMRLIADIYDRPSVDFRNKADLAALASGRQKRSLDILIHGGSRSSFGSRLALQL